MSDEALAPSDGATNDVAQVDAGQAAPAPAATEVSADKPSGSAREALERAFTKLDGEQQSGQRERGPDGKFTAKQAQQAAPPAQVTPSQPTAEALAAEQAAKDAAAVQPAIVPPPGLTKEAQAAWAQTPEPVRKDFERRVTELTQGLEKYKGEVAAFEPIRPYAEKARQSGTTLDQALANYTGIEDAILANPVAGFVQICRNMNLNPQAVGQALAGMSPQQAAQMMPQVQQQQQTPAELKAIQDRLDKMEQEAKSRTIEQTVSAFATEKDGDGALKNPYFDELADDISRMLETGFAKDLPDAYQKAARLNPEIADRIAKDKAAKEAAKTAQQPDPAQTREKAAKSITGSPSSASNASTRKPAGSAREAIANAFAQVGLS